MASEAEERATGIFNETFWGMHRNALILATIFLVVNLPGVSLSEKVEAFALEFDQGGIKYITSVLLLSTLYSVIVLSYEWYRQVFPYIIIKINGLNEALTARRRFLDETSQGIDGVRRRLSGLAGLFEEFKKRPLIVESRGANDLISSVFSPQGIPVEQFRDERVIEDISKRLLSLHELQSRDASGADVKSIIVRISEQIQDSCCITSANKIISYMNENGYMLRTELMIKYQTGLENISNELYLLKQSIESLRNINTSLIYILIGFVPVIAREIVICLLLPWGIFVLAICHILGRNGYNYFISPLYWVASIM